MLNVTLVSVNFWPEVAGIGPYAKAYADLLYAAGHEVTVVTSHPHYPEWRRRDACDDAIPYRVLRCRSYVPSRPTAWGRAAFELSFGLSAYRALRRLPAPDIALAISPSLGGAAAAARWVRRGGRRMPFGFIVQDVVSAATEQSGTGGAVASAGAAALERYVLRRADLVGMVSESFRDRLLSLGASDARLRLVRNWPLSEARRPERNEARARARFRDGDVVCVHAGNMGAKQGLEHVARAAALASRRGLPVRFVLIGDGNQRERLEAMARDIPSLELRPLLPEAELLHALAGADVLLLNQLASVTDMALPSKLTAYARAGAPIVAAVHESSAAAHELRRYGAGLVVPPEDPDALIDAVTRVSADADLRRRLVEGAAAYARDALDRPALAQAFLSFVEECHSSAAPSFAKARKPIPAVHV